MGGGAAGRTVLGVENGGWAIILYASMAEYSAILAVILNTGITGTIYSRGYRKELCFGHP